MACCDCCCGGETCSEGQEGKCCCGGVSGECCQEGEYCCNGACSPSPCGSLTITINRTTSPVTLYAGDPYTVTVTAPAGPAVSLVFSRTGTASSANVPQLATRYLAASASARSISFSSGTYHDCSYRGSVNFRIVVSATGLGSATSNEVTLRYWAAPRPRSASWSVPASVAEGSSGVATVTLSTPGGERMCPWTYTASLINVTTSTGDVTLTSAGSVSVTPSPAPNEDKGTVSLYFTAKPDSIIEGVEYFRVRISDGSYTATSPYIAVVDKTQPATYSLSCLTTVTEGTSLVVQVDTTNLPNGHSLFWSVSPITASPSDFSRGYGTVVMNNNQAVFFVQVYDDTVAEGAETFQVKLYDNGVLKATSPTVTILPSDLGSCPTYNAAINTYTVSLQALGCLSSWFSASGVLRAPLVSASSGTRTYRSSPVVFYEQNYLGAVVTHTIWVEIGTRSSGIGDYMRVGVGASSPGVTYPSIYFTVSCSTLQFAVSNTSGPNLTNPAKALRWSNGCTQDYSVLVSWDAPPSFQAVTGGAGGPGTHLKSMLSKVGIKSTPTCSCSKKAKVMDDKGIEWCESNVDTIVGWLKEEAGKRKMPFVDFVARLIVKRAIKKAKRDNSN